LLLKIGVTRNGKYLITGILFRSTTSLTFHDSAAADDAAAKVCSAGSTVFANVVTRHPPLKNTLNPLYVLSMIFESRRTIDG
jgi:hypothetical protein